MNLEHRLLPTERRIRAVFGGVTIADTPAGFMGFGGYRPPIYELGTWWFPRADVRQDLLRPSDHRTHCDVRGECVYWDVVTETRSEAALAYAYPDAPDGWEMLRDLITFRWNSIEHWYEEDQEVWVHPRGPHHRVDACHSSRHVRVTLDGVVLADTHRPLAVFETGMPTRWYIPPADVAWEHLEASPTRTGCPYKGVADYFNVTVGERTLPDLAWRYLAPVPESPRLEQHVSFFSERVDTEIDGVAQERPVTKWERAIPQRDVIAAV